MRCFSLFPPPSERLVCISHPFESGYHLDLRGSSIASRLRLNENWSKSGFLRDVSVLPAMFLARRILFRVLEPGKGKLMVICSGSLNP